MCDDDDKPEIPVFCIQAFVARAPFIDGSRVETRELGCYTSRDAAIAWIRGKEFREQVDPGDALEKLLAVQVVESNVGYAGHVASVTLSPAGEILERHPEGWWKGRDPLRCRWARGDIAACVYQGRYRVGVVLARPHSVQWVRQQSRPGLTPMDDVYLVGFSGGNLDHHHPSEAMMFEPLAEVPEGLLQLLNERSNRYPTGE
jgi:hypothetical protein